MNAVFQNACYYHGGTFRRGTVSVSDGILRSNGKKLTDARLIDCERYTLIPGLTDVHVHFREPGFSYKETIASGTLAAAHGGYTAVCTMPNLDPAPDDLPSLNIQLDIIRRDACIAVYPYGTITRGEKGELVSDMDAMAPYVCAFSDDGHGVQDDGIMRAAMRKARSLGKLITAHCEDNSLLHGGYIHDGIYCRAHGHRGICSESEWGQIKRDLELVRETGCGYHICHISTGESVELIRRAKREGLDVTCETAPHYLLLDDSMLEEDGCFKMNPPVRSKEDREALTEGILDGTIDMIATDHAPHSAEEKSSGLAGSLMGIVGIETAFPLMYTYLVKKGIITLEKLIELMYTAPSKRFGIANPFEEGKPANFSVWDLDAGYTINPDDFLSKGRATPFTGWKVSGKNRMTVCSGSIAWIDPVMEKGETE
ncbi:MAG: dihydroorotase [Clostridia bacterium]|nr:dihydroorotase [Clostridia bacterium]